MLQWGPPLHPVRDEGHCCVGTERKEATSLPRRVLRPCCPVWTVRLLVWTGSWWLTLACYGLFLDSLACLGPCFHWLVVWVLENSPRPTSPVGQEQRPPFRPNEQPKGTNQGQETHDQTADQGRVGKQANTRVCLVRGRAAARGRSNSRYRSSSGGKGWRRPATDSNCRA